VRDAGIAVFAQENVLASAPRDIALEVDRAIVAMKPSPTTRTFAASRL